MSSHQRDDKVLAPYFYLSNIPGKDVRGQLIDCFAEWIPVSDEQLATIKEIVRVR